MKIINEGQLKGSFHGFKKNGQIFRFTNGRKWRQSEFKYQYHYAHMPRAKVVNNNGQHFLEVDGMNCRVRVQPA